MIWSSLQSFLCPRNSQFLYTRSFITALVRTRHWTLFQERPHPHNSFRYTLTIVSTCSNSVLLRVTYNIRVALSVAQPSRNLSRISVVYGIVHVTHRRFTPFAGRTKDSIVTYTVISVPLIMDRAGNANKLQMANLRNHSGGNNQ
jgi:hypothetical protein